MTYEMKYFEEAKNIWTTQVPRSGQAKTVQGELMRAVEKFRDEAQRNGNTNWDQGFETLASFLIETLARDESLDEESRGAIIEDIQLVTNGKHPYTNDDVYDRLTDKIVEWSIRKGKMVEHLPNPQLRR